MESRKRKHNQYIERYLNAIQVSNEMSFENNEIKRIKINNTERDMKIRDKIENFENGKKTPGKLTKAAMNIRKKIFVPPNVENCLNNVIKEQLEFIKKNKK